MVQRLEPHRIKHRPGAVLDVILSVAADRVPTPEETSDQGQTSNQTASPTPQSTTAAAVSDFFFSLQAERQSSTVSVSAASSTPSSAIAAVPDKLSAIKDKKSFMTPPSKIDIDHSNTRQSGELSTPDKTPTIINGTSTTPPVAANIKTATDRTSFQQSMAGMVERLNIATATISKMSVHEDRPTLIREKAKEIFTQSCDF